jgi:hypothetical protein
MSGTPSGVKPAGQAAEGSTGSSIRAAAGLPSETTMGQAPPGGAYPPVMELAPRAPSIVQYSIAASLGVIAAAALGVGGFWVWKSMQPAPSPVVVVTPVEMEQAPLPPAPPATGTASANAAAVVPALVAFKIVPDKAVLVVDGGALPVATRSLPRPAPGTTVKVVVRADGFEDQALTLDETAPASVDVWLTESAPAAGATPTAAKKSPGPAHPGGGTAPSEALPANPY